MDRPGASVVEQLAAIAARAPDRPALVEDGGETWSFGRLESTRLAWAAALEAAAGGEAHPVVAILLPPGPAYLVGVLAAATAGVALPCGLEAREAELADAWTLAGATLALVLRGHEAAGPAAARGLRVVAVDPGEPPSGARPVGPGPRPESDLVILRTSGTTGEAKMLRIPSLAWTAKLGNLVRALALGPEDRLLSVMPLQHSTGLGTALAALLAGGRVWFPAGGFEPGELGGQLVRSGATWSALAPPMLGAWLRTPPAAADRAHALRFLRSGNGPLAPELAAAAEARFGVPVLQAFGTTETGMVTCQPLPPGVRKPGSSGVRVGPTLAILDPAGVPLPPGAEGAIAVRGPTLPPALLAAAPTRGPDGAPWHLTGDHGFLDPDGYLFVTGRTRDLINVGGRKVAPDEVEAALRRLPGVRDAALIPVADAHLGERAHALVVGDGPLDPALLRRALSERLSPYKVPAGIEQVPALARDALGKLSRHRLAQEYAARSPHPVAPAAGPGAPGPSPADTLGLVLTHWAEITGRPAPGPDEDFLSQGASSLQLVELLARLGQATGVRVPLAELVGPVDRPTPRALARRLEGRPGPPGPGPLVVHRSGRARPLVMIGGRGGLGGPMARFAAALPADRPVHVLEPPRGGWAGIGATTIEAMADHYLGRTLAAIPDGPAMVLGASFGGVLAFELACRLHARGHPCRLAMLDTSAPAPADRRVSLPGVGILASDPRLAALHGILEAHTAALDLYRPAARYPGLILFFLSTGSVPDPAEDPRLGWEDLAAGGLAVVATPGHHVELERPDQVQVVVSALGAALRDEPVGESRAAWTRRFGRLGIETGFWSGTRLRSPAGDGWRVARERRGHLDRVEVGSHLLVVSGWAPDPGGPVPARELVLFQGDRLALRGTTGLARPDVAATLGATEPGFGFRVALGPKGRERHLGGAPLRVFALGEGQAVELIGLGPGPGPGAGP